MYFLMLDAIDTCNNPVEILRYMQSQLIRGRDLDVKDIGRCDGGATNYILVDRQQLLETAFDEIAALKNKFLTLEVQFYSEVCFEIVHISMIFTQLAIHTHDTPPPLNYLPISVCYS